MILLLKALQKYLSSFHTNGTPNNHSQTELHTTHRDTLSTTDSTTNDTQRSIQHSAESKVQLTPQSSEVHTLSSIKKSNAKQTSDIPSNQVNTLSYVAADKSDATSKDTTILGGEFAGLFEDSLSLNESTEESVTKNTSFYTDEFTLFSTQNTHEEVSNGNTGGQTRLPKPPPRKNKPNIEELLNGVVDKVTDKVTPPKLLSKTTHIHEQVPKGDVHDNNQSEKGIASKKTLSAVSSKPGIVAAAASASAARRLSTKARTKMRSHKLGKGNPPALPPRPQSFTHPKRASRVIIARPNSDKPKSRLRGNVHNPSSIPLAQTKSGKRSGPPSWKPPSVPKVDRSNKPKLLNL